MSKKEAEQCLARLPLYFSLTDLVEAFTGSDRLMDAYVLGYLTPGAVKILEEQWSVLQCWLLARILKVLLTQVSQVSQVPQVPR